MTPVRKQQLILAAMMPAADGAAGGQLTLAVQRNLICLHSPSEVPEDDVDGDARFRSGGAVLEESVERVRGTRAVRFQVTDRQRAFPVVCHGILPGLFRERRSVIARGRIEGDALVADQLLAKHHETCMPAEVADKTAQTGAAREAAAAEGGTL